MQVTSSLFSTGSAYKAISNLNDMLDKLQVQLATQEKAATLSELGSDRVFDLTLRSRLSRLDAYQTNIDTTQLRLDYLDNSVTRLDEIESSVRSDLSTSGVGSDGINMASATETSSARLDEVLTILNGDLNGRYMFAGNQTDAKPVVTADLLINGDGTRAGLKQIIAERKLADFGGATGHGRLDIDQIQLSAAAGGSANEVVISESATANGPVINAVNVGAISNVTSTPAAGPPATNTVAFTGLPTDGETLTVSVQHPDGTTEDFTFTAVSGTPANPGEFQIGATADDTATNFRTAFDDHFHANSVTLAEDGAHPFGIKLEGATTDSGDISIVSQTATQPHVLQFSVDTLPQEGETITISYSLPDGSSDSFEIEATTTSPAERGQFVIGADTDATAANIASAITTQLDYIRDTDLSAVSADLAAENMIATNGGTATRVLDPGTGFADAVAMTTASATDTVIWYTGQSSTGSARQTAASRVDDSTTVYYGVQGNELGITELVRATAVMAAESFSTSVTGDADRYQALAQKQVVRLAEVNNGQTGSLEVISLELGLAEATIGAASDRHKSYGVQLETMLSEIESVDVEEVAMQLLTVRTNLEASYQTMSRLSELSLVNYM